jgi:F-type H+-transporting ATPase subunit gamma
MGAADVREIKGRIDNIEDIRQITKAMNAIAMTKVTRMKRRLAAARPYGEAIERVVAAVLAQPRRSTVTHPLISDNESQAVGVLVLNADRGLCGRFKGELNRRAEDLLAEHGDAGRLLAGGEKARAFFARRPVETLRIYTHLYENPTMEIAARIAGETTELFLSGELGRVVLVYMRFVNDLSQRLAVEQLLPVAVEPRGEEAIVEPDIEAVLAHLLPQYVSERVFLALLHTKTSEDAIRRQAMSSATDNADDLLRALTRSYHKARQQSITREISDIMGGAEALRTA